MRTIKVGLALFALTLAALATSTGAGAHGTACGNPFPPFAPEVIVGGELGSVVVPRGEICILEGTLVNGNVLLEPGAGLFVIGGTVTGSVNCDRCFFLDLNQTTVGGSVRVYRLFDGLFVLDSVIGGDLGVHESDEGDFSFRLERNWIGGSLKFDRNVGETSIEDNEVRGDARIYKNDDGPLTVAGNAVGGALQCAQNDPAPSGSGNRATSKEGQCSDL